MLRRFGQLAWCALACLLTFVSIAAGVLLLRSWTLVFLTVTATCLGLATAAVLAERGRAPGRLPTIAAYLTALVGIAGLCLLVEWVAFALLAWFAATAVPLFGNRLMSTPLLCARWASSLEALRAADTPQQAAAILRERARCLDELERRDPEGFQRWLATPDTDPATVLRPREGSA
ncbi:hypothetical protein [Actinokineospora sp. NBRC 105648]|uniref:hypothetical protein n=1 Tax=Actinokineospora sp. NBRC 105648 TaxID=3032206 RepID=UPI0024A0268C|nr:hypothetical protein [Actinokineospora sp. NBRC 105648]GLZ38851.1 hypothetical protein Acsp05_24750 [Actinokineospora sp. NBRC 105648]